MSGERYLTPKSGEVFRYDPWVHGIDLITLRHFDCLPEGTVLISADGRRRVTKGVDYIDRDVRGGEFIAYGLPTQAASADDPIYEGPFRAE